MEQTGTRRPVRLLPRACRLGSAQEAGPAQGSVIRSAGVGRALPFGHASHATRARQPADAPLLLRDRFAWEAPRREMRGLPLADLHGQEAQRRCGQRPNDRAQDSADPRPLGAGALGARGGDHGPSRRCHSGLARGSTEAARQLDVSWPAAEEVVSEGKSVTHASGTRALARLRQMAPPTWSLNP